MTQIVKKHWLFILFLLFFAGLVAYKLIACSTPFFDWDESLYVQNGIEMVKQKFLLVPLWQGKPWLDKPPLGPLIYGLVAQSKIFTPEISTRLFTLFLTIIVLLLIYKLYYQITKNSLIATLTGVLTAFIPIFLQRAQVVSLDVFLLIGWLGYLVYIRKPLISTLFLLLAVQSKSLLGFYPLAIYGLYLLYVFYLKQIKLRKLLTEIRIIFCQILFLSLWYLMALGVYRQDFWQAHIVESHFRRVTASIESHFGQRTFYLTLLFEQLKWWIILAVLGFFGLVWRFWKKQIKPYSFFLATALLPWFIFLNLTKTKIAWYLYPVIPQFAFLVAYTLSFLKAKQLQLLVFGFFIVLIGYQAFVNQAFFTTFYAKEADHVKLAKEAKQVCYNLAVLVPGYTRDTYHTLDKMNLTINTTNWWGEHPSMVYYFAKPLTYFYSPLEFKQKQPQFDCLAINANEQKLISNKNKYTVRDYNSMLLYKAK